MLFYKKELLTRVAYLENLVDSLALRVEKLEGKKPAKKVKKSK